MPELKRFLRKPLSAVAAIVLLCHVGVVSAVGFGPIRVNSTLNEPLDATIELVSLSAAERDGLDVSIASPEMFQRFGIARTALAARIDVSVVRGGDGSARVRLRTNRPVNEPFLRFLLQARTSEGQALREYTVLLDPPASTPTPSAAPEPAPQPSRSTSSPQSRSAAPRPSVARRDDYGPVAPGQSLSRIADSVQYDNVSLEQMQIAIYRANPDAFAGNMNVLLRGARLSIPSLDEVRAIGRNEARSAVEAQRQEMMARRNSRGSDRSSDSPGAGEPSPSSMTATRLRLQPPSTTETSTASAGNTGNRSFGRLLEPDFSSSAAADTASASGAATGGAGDSAATGAGSDADMTGEDAAANDARLASGAGDTSAESSATGNDPSDDETASADAVQTSSQTIDPADDSNDTSVAAGDLSADAAETDGADQVVANENDPATADGASDEAGYQPLSGNTQDVTGTTGSTGLLSVRNILLLAAVIVLLIGLVIWSRRRQYKPVPLNFNDDTAKRGPHVGNTSAKKKAAKTEPAPVETIPAATRVENADRQMNSGLFDDARKTLEAGLSDHPHDTALQEKRVELDYQRSNKKGFLDNVNRFENDLAADTARWAAVAAMGRELYPRDMRFADGEDSSEPMRTDESSKKEPSPDQIMDDFDRDTDEDTVTSADGAESSDDASRGFSIDFDEESDGDHGAATPPAARRDDVRETPDNDFAWEDQAVETTGEREHDKSDDQGMAFDLDAFDASDDRGADAASDDSRRAQEMKPVDVEGFDLDGDTVDDGDSSDAASEPAETDDNSVETRLELARMYVEMDDESAARELLVEVEAEGDDDQKAEARRMLEDLKN